MDNEGPLEMSGKEAKEVKLGLTGLTVTIIDYTLSRADIEPGRAAYIDLEHLGGMFDQAGDIQADTYRL